MTEQENKVGGGEISFNGEYLGQIAGDIEYVITGSWIPPIGNLRMVCDFMDWMEATDGVADQWLSEPEPDVIVETK